MNPGKKKEQFISVDELHPFFLMMNFGKFSNAFLSINMPKKSHWKRIPKISQKNTFNEFSTSESIVYP